MLPGRVGLTPALCLLALAACLPRAPEPPPSQVPVATQQDAADTADAATPEIFIDGGTTISAKEFFEQRLLPSLMPSCGACHRGRAGDLGPPFMASVGPDSYDPYPTMRSYRNFIVENPDVSLLVTRGPHEGPALNMDQEELARTWIRMEHEADLRTMTTTQRPQVRPFTPQLAPTVNKVDLTPLDRKFTGAYLQFTATAITPQRGLVIKDLRLVNKLPGAQPGDQRTLRVVRPLLIQWTSGGPAPDLGDSMASVDKTVALDEKSPGGEGVVLSALVTLGAYRAGDALSFAFNSVSLVGKVVSPNVCRPAGLTHFANNLIPYLKPATGCTRANEACHNDQSRAGGLTLTPTLMPVNPAALENFADICEQIKFLRNAGTLVRNINPANPEGSNHRFRYDTTNCQAVGLPANCYTSFAQVLSNWATDDP